MGTCRELGRCQTPLYPSSQGPLAVSPALPPISFPLSLTPLSNRHAASIPCMSVGDASHSPPHPSSPPSRLLPPLPFLCQRTWSPARHLGSICCGWQVGAQKGGARGRFTRRGCTLSSRLDTRCDQHDTDTCLRDQTHSLTQSKGQTSAC